MTYLMLPPDYETDQQSDRMNPVDETDLLVIPGIKCEFCGRVWAGSRRLYLPESEVGNVSALKEVWPLVNGTWNDLVTHVKKQSNLPDHFIIKPGDVLNEPTYLLKGKTNSIMFPPLGFPLINQELAEMLVGENLSGVNIHTAKVFLAKKKSTEVLPPLFVLKVEENYQCTSISSRLCSFCGYEEIKSNPNQAQSNNELSDFYICDENPNQIYVNQKVVDVFNSFGVSNVQFRAIQN